MKKTLTADRSAHPAGSPDSHSVMNWRRLAESPATARVMILVTPLLAFLALRLPSISQNNFTDAMYYLGYSRNFVDLIDRYGFIYYAVRFGPIFPEMAFAHVFGFPLGFHLLRYLLFVGVAWLLHAVLAERYGRRFALFGVIAWAFNPVTARILLSTYVDSTVVPFTLMGLLLLLLEQRRTVYRSVLAGVLLCAGVSGNVYAGVMIALAAPAYIWLNATRPVREILAELLTTLAGAVLTLLLFTALYDHLFGITSLLQPAIDVTLRLAGGDAKQWTRPPAEWLFDSPHIYGPILILIGTLALWHWTRDRLALAAASYLLLFVLFYWVSDLFFDGYSLSFYPYFSYWQGALMLGVGVTSAQAMRLSRPAQAGTVGLLLVLALAGPAILFARAGLPAPAFGWLAGALLLAVIGVGASFRRPTWRPYALAGVLATASLLQAGSPFYNMMLGKPDSDDRELVRAALELTDVLPRIAEDGKELTFWYSTTDDRRIKMVQSVYLPFSRLLRGDGTPVELGPLSTADLEPLNNPQRAHLVILDFSRERVDAGLRALTEAGVMHRLAQRRRLGSKRFALEMAHVILDHPHDPNTTPLPATVLRPHPDATIRYHADGAVLTTGKVVRNWDATVDLAAMAQPGAPVTVSVTLQVLKGRATLALIRRGSPDQVLQENLAPQTRTPVEVSVRAAEGGDADVLAIRNAMEDGTRAVIRIDAASLFQPRQAPDRLSRLTPRVSTGTTGLGSSK